MTPLQNLWTTFFLFLPVIYLGVNFSWLTGLLAFLVSMLLSWSLGFLTLMYASERMSLATMTIWAWVKPPLIALVVLRSFTIF
jgi:hypothetical protein